MNRQAISTSANWIWNFFVVMITPVILNRLKWKGYLIFMCLNFSFIPLVYFCYPETANLTLEEIDYLFTKEGNKGAKQLFKKSQPVIESLKNKSEIREDIEKNEPEIFYTAPSERKEDMSSKGEYKEE